MTSRSQYLVFLIIWLIAILILLVVAIAVDFPLEGRDLNGFLFGAGVVALLPAAAGYLLARKASATIDKWRARRGNDVHRYEDDSGFIHLNELPACEQEQEVSVKEIVSGLGQAAMSDDLTRDLK